LNGANITGDSLLSLAEAYVTSINSGSVPCIESAWTSVCKDECQRASSESITYLKHSLAELVKSDGSSVLSSEEVKDRFDQLLKEALDYFAQKAVGDEHSHFLESIK